MKMLTIIIMVLVFFAAAAVNAGAGVWTPEEIDTRAWYDAADLDTIISTSGSVSQWDNKSGGNNLTQGDSNRRPTTGARTLNGLNGIDFDGTERIDSSAFSLDTTDMTVIALYEYDVVTASDRVLSIRRNNISEGQNDVFTYNGGDRLGYRYPINDTVSGRTTTTDPVLNAYVTSGTDDQRLHTDGALTPYIEKDTIDTFVSQLIVVGGSGQANQYDFDGAVYEIVILDSAISDADRQKMEGYLAWKWGLEASLPVDHLYYSAAPTVPELPPGAMQIMVLALGFGASWVRRFIR